MTTRSTLTLAAAVFMLGPAAAQDALTPAPPVAQEFCPVTPAEAIDPNHFADFRGLRVYFCCGRCREKFIRDPDRYAARLAGLFPAGAHSGAQADESAPPGHGSEPSSAADETPASSHADERGNLYRPGLIAWLGRFHPAATDFPIALLLTALVAELLFIPRRRLIFDHAARFCLWAAALTGLVAAGLGWCFAGLRALDDDALLLAHRWMGTGAAAAIVLVLALSEYVRAAPARRRGLYRGALVAAALLILGAAFLGGAMVWGLDHYVL